MQHVQLKLKPHKLTIKKIIKYNYITSNITLYITTWNI